VQIWPAIDLRDGKCVRLEQGNFDRETVFGDDPVEMARKWVAQGAQCLHLVDLDGARDGRPSNHDVIGRIVSAVQVPCQLGGGIRDEATIRALLNAGVDRLVIGTKALREPDWFRKMCDQFPDRMVLGIDAEGGLVATDGWLQTSDQPATELARTLAHDAIKAIVYTDIAKDGMLAGPNLEAMSEMNQAVSVPVVASGGVTTEQDIRNLANLGMAGCIIGRALYEQRLTLADALSASR
jgi:phosphoribosylformimino-5-aminoimidazole carboxamide ribotide isomerase